MATFTKFRKTGEWAIKAERHKQPGDWVIVEKRDGTTRRAQLGACLWAGDGAAIYRIAGRDRTPAPEVPRADDVRAYDRARVEELPAALPAVPMLEVDSAADELAAMLARPAKIADETPQWIPSADAIVQRTGVAIDVLHEADRDYVAEHLEHEARDGQTRHAPEQDMRATAEIPIF